MTKTEKKQLNFVVKGISDDTIKTLLVQNRKNIWFETNEEGDTIIWFANLDSFDVVDLSLFKKYNDEIIAYYLSNQRDFL